MVCDSLRRLKFAIAVASLCAAALPAVGQAPPATTPDGPPAIGGAEASYLIGVDFASQLSQRGLSRDLSEPEMARGIKDGLAGKKATADEQQRIARFIRDAVEASTTRNEEAAKAFLAKNGKEKGVVTTASGLQYRIVSAGDPKGKSPQATDQVTVHYRGKLLDGTEFDSSYARGAPATFPLDGVIKGWTEGLQLMKPGAKAQLFVPPDLAYGRAGRPSIPGGSLLIFDVELLSIGKLTAPAQP